MNRMHLMVVRRWCWRPCRPVSAVVAESRWRSALEFRGGRDRTESVVRTVAGFRHFRGGGLAAAGSSRALPRQAAQHFAAAFPAVPRTPVEPDFRRTGIRDSGVRLALAGAPCRGARSACRTRACANGRPEASHPVSPHAIAAGIDRANRCRCAGGRDIQVCQAAAGAARHGKCAANNAQGEAGSEAKGNARQSAGKSEGRSKAKGSDQRSQGEHPPRQVQGVGKSKAKGRAGRSIGERVPEAAQGEGGSNTKAS